MMSDSHLHKNVLSIRSSHRMIPNKRFETVEKIKQTKTVFTNILRKD